MVKYYIDLRGTCRLGQELFEAIGPFDSVESASRYVLFEINKWAVQPKGIVIRSIYTPC